METKNSVSADRPLAQIVKVKSCEPIKKTDNLMHAMVLGWKVVINKNEKINVDDLVVYFSLDAMLDNLIERLLKSTNLDEGGIKFLNSLKGKPIKTKKIMNAFSQGLIFTFDFLKKHGIDLTTIKLVEGENLTQFFGITKYVHDDELNQYAEGGTRSAFPDYIRKTDEHRIQDYPEHLDQIDDEDIIMTRKEDGCSATYVWNNGKFYVCGRNYLWKKKDESNEVYFTIAEKFNIEKMMEQYNKNIAIQGEIVGPKINGNRLKLKELDFKVFNIWDIDGQVYLTHDDIVNIIGKMKLNMVPVLFKGKLSKEERQLDALLERANKLKYECGSTAEGFVIKTQNRSISFKVISNDYLLKNQV